jgi:methylated-DNA-[protein]-cysteine S-methyltransferase
MSNVKKTKAQQSYDAIFRTELATIGIRLSGEKLTTVEYLGRRKEQAPTSRSAAKIQKIIEKLIKGKTDNRQLDIAMTLDVTPFQKKVLEQLMKIPPGETRTYGEIARKLRSSPRAVGNACRNNPISIIIPCHRVVSASGIGGYSGATEGATLDIKRRLLQREGVDSAVLA